MIFNVCRDKFQLKLWMYCKGIVSDVWKEKKKKKKIFVFFHCEIYRL